MAASWSKCVAARKRLGGWNHRDLRIEADDRCRHRLGRALRDE
jgi:hypothetical protein